MDMVMMETHSIRKKSWKDHLFNEDMPLKAVEEKFLSNHKNTNKYTTLLFEKFVEYNFECHEAGNDADRLISQPAVNCSSAYVASVADVNI